MSFTADLLPSDPNSFLKILVELYTYGLKDESLELLEGGKKNWSILITSDNFALLPLFFLEATLRSDLLTLTEEILWDRCIVWAKYQFDREHSIEGLQDGLFFMLPMGGGGGWGATFHFFLFVFNFYPRQLFSLYR